MLEKTHMSINKGLVKPQHIHTKYWTTKLQKKDKWGQYVHTDLEHSVKQVAEECVWGMIPFKLIKS